MSGLATVPTGTYKIWGWEQYRWETLGNYLAMLQLPLVSQGSGQDMPRRTIVLSTYMWTRSSAGQAGLACNTWWHKQEPGQVWATTSTSSHEGQG